jgi:hypothetical protein
MWNVSDKIVEKIKTPVLCSINFFQSHDVYEIMWKNMIQPDRPQMTVQYGAGKVWLLRWMTKAKIQAPLITFNTYCFSVVTTVMQMFSIVTVYVYCFSCIGICCGEKACYAFKQRSIWDTHLTDWKIQIMFFTQTKRQFAKL